MGGADTANSVNEGRGVAQNRAGNQKSSKKELLQTILLPKNLGMLKGKLPKANYKKAESIDDMQLDYEREEENSEKDSLALQMKQTNRILSAGPRRPA